LTKTTSTVDEQRRVTNRMPLRGLAIAATCWAIPYFASKILHALQGRLGVHGGPTITSESYAQYGGAAEISAAQWDNVAVAVLITALALLPVVPVTHRWNRWLRTLPVIVAAVFLVSMSLLFGMRVIAGDGGLPFTLYMVFWTVLVCALIPASLSIDQRERGR
jgi:hypothetical protein